MKEEMNKREEEYIGGLEGGNDRNQGNRPCCSFPPV